MKKRDTSLSNVQLATEILELVRGIRGQQQHWTIKGFIHEAILEKFKRDNLRPRPCKTVRPGALPRVRAS